MEREHILLLVFVILSIFYGYYIINKSSDNDSFKVTEEMWQKYTPKW